MWTILLSLSAFSSRADVVINENHGPLSVGVYWNPDNRYKIYKHNFFVKKNQPDYSFLSFVLAEFIETPLYTYLLPVVEYYKRQTENIDDSKIVKIAYDCRFYYKNKPWNQVACVAYDIRKYIRNAVPFNRTNDANICRLYASAFKLAFEALNLPYAYSHFARVRLYFEYKAPQWHRVNRIIFRNRGKVFAYAIDIELKTIKLYPSSFHAMKFHDKNHDGMIDDKSLPSFSKKI